MKPYITNIHINELYHLKDFDIQVADAYHPHLIITGKNGSGKTILLRALVEYLDKIKGDKHLSCLAYDENIAAWESNLKFQKSEYGKASARQSIQIIQKQKEDLYGKINLLSSEMQSIIEAYNANNLLLAFYAADRMVSFKEPKNPQKPDLRRHLNIKETSTDQLLIFLVDLKIQEALLRNENEQEEANRLGMWFEHFQDLMCKIYQDENLHIRFNPRTYEFFIQTNEKKFKFTQMSDGYAAIIDIVADLILKMQDNLNSISSVYDKAGIVIIDEIETHLHLELQKLIMPMLTQMFPNIQFIVTTHSPFVLNSISNASVFDLEHRKILEDLSDYSYEALAEGYFGVTTESSTVEMRFNKLKTLLEMKEWTPSEMNYIRQLITELDKISEAVSPDFVGAYRQLLLKYVAKLNDIRK